jgi:hypothetical protein
MWSRRRFLEIVSGLPLVGGLGLPAEALAKAGSALQHCKLVYRQTSFFLSRAWNSGDLGFAQQETTGG